MAETTTLVFSDETSHKFYRVAVQDTTVTLSFGPVGQSGQSKNLHFETLDEAHAEASRRLRAKLRKGYVPVEGVDQDPVKATRKKAAKKRVRAWRLDDPNAPVFAADYEVIRKVVLQLTDLGANSNKSLSENAGSL